MKKPTCRIEGCDKPIKARGYCSRHYFRVWSGKDPAKDPEPRLKSSVVSESLESLRRELRNERALYEITYGHHARLARWQTIQALERRIREIENA